MAKTQLLGISVVKKSAFIDSKATKGIVYFVRNDNPTDDKTEGYIYFDGKQYGNAAAFAKKKWALKKINGQALTDADGIIKDVMLYGKDITLSGYTEVEQTSRVAPGDTINEAFAKIQKALDDVGGDAITEIVAGNGIAVTPKENHKQTVSVKIDADNKNGLSTSEDGLALAQASTEVYGATQLVGTSGSTVNDKAATPKLVDDTIKSLNATQSAQTTDGYISVQVAEEGGMLTSVSVTDKVVAVSGATSSNKGLAEASDVKDYVDSTISDLTVSGVTLGADETIESISEEGGKIVVAKQNILIAHGQVSDWANNIGVTAVTSGDTSVTVADDTTQNPKVAVNINANDKVLSTDNGLKTTLSVNYDSTNRKVQLLGKENALISEFDASDFVKDGMLWGETAFLASAETQTVSITKGTVTQTHDFTNLTVGDTYIAFCFTDGATAPKYTWEAINISAEIKPYNAGNGITITGQTISAKVKAGNGLSVDSTDGIKMALADTKNAGAVTLNDTIAATGSADDTTAATPGAVRDAIDALNATKSGQTTDGYISVQVAEEGGMLTSVSVTDKVVAVSGATSSNKGLAEASDVKAYSDGKSVNGATGHTIVINSTDVKLGENLVYSDKTIANSGDTIYSGFTKVVEQMVENEETTATALENLGKRIDDLDTNQVTASGVTYRSTEVSGSTTDVLNNIYSKLATDEDKCITGITSSGKTVTVTESGNTRNLEVTLEKQSESAVDTDGHIEIKANANGGLFAVMYYDNQDE